MNAITMNAAAGKSPAPAKVDPQLIDDAINDLEIANTFTDAAVNYLDDARSTVQSIRGEGCGVAIHLINRADTLLHEADNRFSMLKGRLETALDLAIAAWKADTIATGTEFAEKFAAWEAARKARQDFDDANRPTAKGLSPEMQAFEFALSPYHDACLDTAMAVIKSPAPDVAALVCKQRVFYAEEMQQCSETSSEAMAVLFADAIRFAGGAA